MTQFKWSPELLEVSDPFISDSLTLFEADFQKYFVLLVYFLDYPDLLYVFLLVLGGYSYSFYNRVIIASAGYLLWIRRHETHD